ncbi:MAG: TlpA family protein disulfide reductase [Alphaproteobacteria bacterium]
MLWVKRLIIHTGIMVLLASIVLMSPAAAKTKDLLVIYEKPETLEIATFSDAKLAPVSFPPKIEGLSIVHLWATWCAPCVKELPELDAFAKKHKALIEVYPVALDGKNVKKVQDFYKEHGIHNLSVYMDSTMQLSRSVKSKALPTTLFLNGNGELIARADGPLDWQSERLLQFIASHIPQ